MKKIQRNMAKTIFDSEEELLKFIKEYIVEISIGDKEFYGLSPNLLTFFSQKAPTASENKSVSQKLLDDLKKEVKDTIIEALGGSCKVTVNENTYTVTLLGNSSVEILTQFLRNKHEDIPILIAFIKEYYKEGGKRTINKFFEDGIWENYMDVKETTKTNYKEYEI